MGRVAHDAEHVVGWLGFPRRGRGGGGLGVSLLRPLRHDRDLAKTDALDAAVLAFGTRLSVSDAQTQTLPLLRGVASWS